jgi:hypothetical protein
LKTLKSVKAGIDFLDERLPGWEQHIDLETLDLSSPCGCVLGQTHKFLHPRSKEKVGWKTRYSRMVDELGIEQPRSFGFLVRNWTQRYESLTEAWTKAITAKRNGEKVTA